LYPVYDSPLLAAGATLYHYMRVQVTGRRMRIAAIGVDGEAFDSFVVEPPPVLKGGVVNSASGTEAIGRSGLISLYGWQFALESFADDTGEVRVLVGGVEARVIAATPVQLNVALPPSLIGMQTVEIVTPAGSTRAEIEIRPVAPALFVNGLYEDRANISEILPTSAGRRISALLTGVSEWKGPVNLYVAGESVGSQLEDLSPGLQRLLFTVPAKAANGSYPVQIEAGGQWSNIIQLVVGS
jgi:uncharacterized protein (TIGR03437 family)